MNTQKDSFPVRRKTMLERDIERKLCYRIKALGGTCEKFTSPGRRSVPDRLVTLPDGSIVFVELKAPGKKPSNNQAKDHDRRRALGCKVLVIDSFDGIDNAFPL